MQFNIFNRKKDIPITEERAKYNPYGTGSLMYNSISSYSNKKALLLSAVYRCVEVVSDSVAQLPLEPYLTDSDGYKTKAINHPTYYLLSKEPNKVMSRFTFMKTLVTSVLLSGNGYAIINRVGDTIDSLVYVKSDMVCINNTPTGITYTVAGIKGNIPSKDMIHILNFSYDGITGISTLSHARNTLELAHNSEEHAQGFFKSGANLSGILTVQDVLRPEQISDIKASWAQSFGTNGTNAGGLAVLQGNMAYSPITISPADSQLLETREYNTTDICRFFGVSPIKAFDFSNSSYSTVEATQLAFLTDTLAPLLEKIELEFERKLFTKEERNVIELKFDTAVLLRADKASLASYYQSLFNIGAVTPNEIRKEINLGRLDNGDDAFVQVNMVTLNNAVNTLVPEPETLIDNNAL